MKDLFPLTREVSYLDTAAEGLPPLSSETALMAYWREKSRGTPGRASSVRDTEETEQAAAKLLDTSAENVVLLANSSEALNLLANSIDWRAGDEVLISDLEFPSNVLVWLRLKEIGVRVNGHSDRGRSVAAGGLDVAAVTAHAYGVGQPGEL